MVVIVRRRLTFVFAAALSGGCAAAIPPAPNQNPSPMQEHTRRHGRVADRLLGGERFQIANLLPKPVEIYLPASIANAEDFDLLLHFHGAAFIPNTAAERSELPIVAVTINLGAGSSAYERSFFDPDAFRSLLVAVRDSLSPRTIYSASTPKIYLSAFSAGYGAVRSILRQRAEDVEGVLLLDGLHCSYVPEGVVLSEGGRLNENDLAPFIEYARLASDGKKRFVITHSEIFPGTFCSSTEATDFVIAKLGLERNPVMEWGPHGMQLLSRTTEGRFAVLGFAGNTAPDHVDHLHALAEFLRLLVEE